MIKRIAIIFFVFICFTLFPQETMNYPLFGEIKIYQKTDNPEAFVLFLSGDGGISLNVVEMINKLVEQNALVVGINTVHYMLSLGRQKECTNSAGDLEILGKDIQKKLNLKHYLTPILAGYSSGASLAYIALAQAQPNTFLGALTLGFCIDVDYNVNFCKGQGLMFEKGTKNLEPTSVLENPWYTLNGDIDKVTNLDNVRRFVKKTNNAHLVELSKVGHGFSNKEKWNEQYISCYKKISDINIKTVSKKISKGVSDLPIIELLDNVKNDKIILILTGDGGWATIDKKIASYFNKKGYGVIGFDCLKYFRDKKSPDITARDIGRIIEYYSKKLDKNNFIIIGYSFGADVLPFVATRLENETSSMVKKYIFLGISNYAEFEFHLSDWFGSSRPTEYSTKNEVEKIPPDKMIFIAGEDESDSLLKKLDNKKYKLFILKGGHHYNGDYENLAKLIESNF